MRAFTIVLCLVACVWGTSANTLRQTLLELLASEVDVKDVARADADAAAADAAAPSAGDGQCKCCKHGCFCTGKRGRFTASARIALDEIHKKSCCPDHVIATFMVPPEIFEDTFPVNTDHTVCSPDNKYCFEIDVKDCDKRCQHFMHGFVQMTKPVNMTLGAFNLPLATETDEVTVTDTDDLIF